MRTIELFGVRYCAATQSELLAAITAPLQPGECRTAAFAPVTSLSQAARDDHYRAVLNGMSLCAMDGMPVVRRARKKDPTLADIQRCSGPDMMRLVLDATRHTGARHYFYGTSEENLAVLRDTLAREYPDLCVAGTLAPPFRPLSEAEEADHIRQIREADPDYLWVALGAPRQDCWVARHAGQLPGMRVLAVGAALNFLTGAVQRAPAWMRRAGLEWLYRIVREPRQFWRYAKNGGYFVYRSVREDLFRR